MEHMGVTVDIRHRPELDEKFMPIHRFNTAFLSTADKPFGVALTRNGAQVAAIHTFIHGTKERFAADVYYIDRLIKTMLWMKGGYKISVCGDARVYREIAAAYSPGGVRSFDSNFMSRVYEVPFAVEQVDSLPQEYDVAKPVGRHLDGCRIGFDAGGSDRKVSALIDGQCVFSEEVVWNPKVMTDPDYHYREIVKAFRAAAAHLPRVDAIGVSSAGIFIDNLTRVASLFLHVPQNLFKAKAMDIYLRAAKEIADVPIEVCNDGDVTALAGAMSLKQNNVLGIAMGTSEAAGFVDGNGNITGWLNELAFVTVDANPAAVRDEWSGDIGCGVKYFSQDAVIKLAERAGIDMISGSLPSEKLRIVQTKAAKGDERALRVYSDIGVYLGHTLAFYSHLYSFSHVLLLGRVVSGVGGDIMLKMAQQVLREEYPSVASSITVSLPNENLRRVGQSMAAASLARIQVERC